MSLLLTQLTPAVPFTRWPYQVKLVEWDYDVPPPQAVQWWHTGSTFVPPRRVWPVVVYWVEQEPDYGEAFAQRIGAGVQQPPEDRGKPKYGVFPVRYDFEEYNPQETQIWSGARQSPTDRGKPIYRVVPVRIDFEEYNPQPIQLKPVLPKFPPEDRGKPRYGVFPVRYDFEEYNPQPVQLWIGAKYPPTDRGKPIYRVVPVRYDFEEYNPQPIQLKPVFPRLPPENRGKPKYGVFPVRYDFEEYQPQETQLWSGAKYPPTDRGRPLYRVVPTWFEEDYLLPSHAGLHPDAVVQGFLRIAPYVVRQDETLLVLADREAWPFIIPGHAAPIIVPFTRQAPYVVFFPEDRYDEVFLLPHIIIVRSTEVAPPILTIATYVPTWHARRRG